jgi:pectinesterase
MYTISILLTDNMIYSLRKASEFCFHSQASAFLPVRLFYRKQESFMNQNIQKEYHISPDGSGDFSSLFEALSALQDTKFPEETNLAENLPADPDFRTSGGDAEPVVLFLHSGIYRERIVIVRPGITIIGDDPQTTVITGGLYARMPMEDIGKRGTFRTFSCLIASHDITFKNVTFENSSGKGPDVGQALALYADGDRLVFDNCRFLGNQDTLFTAPLPPKEIEPNGFVGPGQKLPRAFGRHYYKNCYLEGDIDFIFGGAAAYFENCELFSKNINRPVNSYVTAASTPQGQPYGYVMKNCRFTGNCPPHSAYLGRPWREYAKTVLLNCYIGEHICEEGWHDWNKEEAHEYALYAEYESTGPSSDMKKRPGWVKSLTPAEAALYVKSLVLKGNDGWDPA